jgi:methionine-gamma-lyase
MKEKEIKRELQPESQMMSFGYKPELSEGAIKCPIFQTSTFVFKNAEEGKAFFELAYGLRQKDEGEEMGLIYSRLNNPDLEILENRLCLWDDAEEAASFVSGMAAISTTFLTFLKPGDSLIYSKPVYGGTDYFVNNILPSYGIKTYGFIAGVTNDEIINTIGKDANVKMIFIETPANPTNTLIDLDEASRLAKYYSNDDSKCLLAVDNTYLGPVWQHPLEHGADLILYSATKFISGHSDVIAGACLGRKELIEQVKVMRTFMGSMASPFVVWLLMRSLETLKIRMERQVKNAKVVAEFLRDHPKVDKVHYLGFLTEEDDSKSYKIFKTQCKSAGSMISFDIIGGEGGEKEAFVFLNSLKLIQLAVSLGSTESLAEHPATMTHSDIMPEDQVEMGILPSMVRLSIGVENADDLVWDTKQALEKV